MYHLLHQSSVALMQHLDNLGVYAGGGDKTLNNR